jgi:NADH-quinone oxidoreductase subunit L
MLAEYFNLLIILSVFLPLAGAVVTGLFVRNLSPLSAQLLTCVPMVSAAVTALLVFYGVVYNGLDASRNILPWIQSGGFSISWSLHVDVLTACMMVLITSVSAVVHVYSVGYMSHDNHRPRFMAYLSLFTFCMLMLVTANNFIQLFFGWEGVGLCSYLLIGFWFKKQSANAAAMKAFIVNRVGDFGFALGIALIFYLFGTVEFQGVFDAAIAYHAENPQLTWNILGMMLSPIEVVCLLLFVGAMGKSAQFLLHTWLPDAMEGPTPVSALIHAATMVTAGVFLVARTSPLFEMAPAALTVVTYVGGFTAIFAASIGLVQNDIKRVIAYSTCSQLGYMFFACGVSAYSAGVFHLLTHGFFKALLFLGAGSVIHAMSNEQDMRNMGGIWKKIPITYVYMWVGSLALAGLPYFAGYFSKDMVLEAAYASHSTHGHVAFWLGIGAAFMTAFYSWRLLFMTFHGKPRASKKVMDHVHESPAIMLVPLVVLFVGALGSGAYGYYVLGIVDGDYAFWRDSLTVLATNNSVAAAHHVPVWVVKLPLVVSVIGIFLAWLFYIKCPSIPARIAGLFGVAYRFLLNKWYIDELYDALWVRPTKQLGVWLWRVLDSRIIDGLGPNGAAAVSRIFARWTSDAQSGLLYHYAFAMIMGLAVLLSWLIIVMLG